jgi:hypothetical protein
MRIDSDKKGLGAILPLLQIRFELHPLL